MERYDSYKDSGTKWLGEIPSHWDVASTRYIAKLYTGNSLDEKAKEYYSKDIEKAYPYISSKDISLNTEEIDYNNGIKIPVEEANFELAPKDSFLLCIEGGSAGRKIAYLDRKCCFVNKLCCFKTTLFPKYHYYYAQTYYFKAKFKSSIQGLIGGVPVSTLKDFKVTIPTWKEQIAIANYLDKATSKIGEAIAQQQKVIDLLNERKQIIINNAVTKGLNPNVPMKNSGIEWIGQVPKHWRLNRLKTFMSIRDKRNFDAKAILLSVYTAIGVKPRAELEEKGNKASTVLNYKIVNKGDLIVNRLLAWMGAYGISNYNGVTSPDYDVYSFKEEYHKDYFGIMFRNTNFKSDCYKYGHGIMMMRWRTYPSEFLNIIVPIPPFEEQKQIYDYLLPQIDKMNEGIEKCNHIISLLLERKQIIINDVVTGKIKVI